MIGDIGKSNIESGIDWRRRRLAANERRGGEREGWFLSKTRGVWIFLGFECVAGQRVYGLVMNVTPGGMIQKSTFYF